MTLVTRAHVIAAVALVSLAGCRLHDARINPEPPLQMPEAWANLPDLPDQPAGEGASEEDSEPTAALRWWEDFREPGLDRSVERALQANMGIRQAWARMDQAAAIARQSASAWYPQIDASLGVGTSRVNTQQVDVDFDQSPPAITSEKVAMEVDNFNVSIAAGFEIDLWGRVASLESASATERLAGREDLSALAVTLAAQISETWFLLAEQHALLALLDQQLQTSEMFLELVTLRFRQGLATALDIRQQRQQLAALKAEVPLVQARAATMKSQLSILQGRAPQEPDLELPGTDIPDAPPIPDVGIPSDLLKHRPDIRAARLRVTAADHRVGVAIADQFPALRFSASTGFADSGIETLFTSWIYNLIANLVAPLFDGGRRSAEVDRVRAVLEDRLYGYGQSVLNAFKEVDDALILEARYGDHHDALVVTLEQARSTLDEARSRYQQGLADYLPVLSALQSVQQTERRVVSVRRQLLSYRIQLHRALGGTWAKKLKRAQPEAPDAEEPDAEELDAEELDEPDPDEEAAAATPPSDEEAL